MLIPPFALRAEIPIIPTYEVGEVAVSDVIAPVAFAVANPEETKRLKELESQRAPLVFRYCPKATAEAEAGLLQAIAEHRRQFLGYMERAANRNVLDEPTLNHPSFARFVAWCQARDKAFPLTMDLARTWALGQSDDAFVARLVDQLHSAMDRMIVSEPADSDLHAESGKVVWVKSLKRSLSLNAVLESGKEAFLDEIEPIADVRKELDRDAGDRRAAQFVGSLIQPNCVYDPAATRAYRDHRVGRISATDFYQPGDLIVTSGEIIDTRTKRALDVLQQKRLEEDKRAVVAQARRDHVDSLLARVDQVVTMPFSWAESFVHSEYRYPIGIGVCLFLLLILRRRRQRIQPSVALRSASSPSPYAVVVNRNRQETIFVPLETHTATIVTGGQAPAPLPVPFEFPALPGNVPWEEKVLAAEKRAEELLDLMRAGLAPHLAKYLMIQFVRELLSQRHELLKTQEMSENEITRLEDQVGFLQKELVERLNQYEARTSDLEKEVTAKRTENEELLRTVMGITKNQQAKVESGTEPAVR